MLWPKALIVVGAGGLVAAGVATEALLHARASADAGAGAPLAQVADTVGLKRLPAYAYRVVLRYGFAAPGDAPPLLYVANRKPCPLDSGEGDGGSQVRSADGGCWIASFPSGEFDVREFGARANGATDDSGAINAAVAAAAATGGGRVVLPPGVLAIAHTIAVTTPNILLTGCGAGGYQQGNPKILKAACSRLKWIGAGGDSKVVSFASPAGGQGQVGGGLAGVFIDAGNTAGYGFYMSSWRSGRFTDIVVYQARIAGYYFTQTVGLALGPTDNQQNRFEDYQYIVSNARGNASRGMWLTGGAATSPNQGNTSENIFINGQLEADDPHPAVELDDTDDNSFYGLDTGFYGEPASTRPTIVLGSSDQGGPARYNFFYFVLSTNTELMASQTGGKSSFGNVFVGYSKADSVPDVTFQRGGGGAKDAAGTVIYTDGRTVTDGVEQSSRLAIRSPLG